VTGLDEARLVRSAGAVVQRMWDAMDAADVFIDQPTEDFLPAACG
jgi:hypothetical protein